MSSRHPPQCRLPTLLSPTNASLPTPAVGLDGLPRATPPCISKRWNDKVASNEPSECQVKCVKRGFRELMTPKVCGMVFEVEPAWLWSIRLSEFSSILISASNERTLRLDFKHTWDKVNLILVIIEDSAVGSPNVDFWMISGSWDFLSKVHQWALNGTSPSLMWVHPSVRRKPTQNSVSSWMSLSHGRVGGATNICGMFGTSGSIPSLKHEKDPVSRTIEHILKYSVRPMPCPPEFREPHYLVSDRLSVHLLDQPVLYSTCFSRTGWGQRSLSDAELAHAYDLPSWVPWDARFRLSLVPIHLLRVVLDQTLVSLGPAIQSDPPLSRGVSPTRLSQIQADVPLADGVFLPGINRWLPGSWADAVIADRAVKSDNACVDFSPWHRRISLVLPCGATTILQFEALAHRWWRRRVVRSFRHYLTAAYGPRWQQSLWSARRANHGGSGKRSRVSGLTDGDSPNKRARRTCGAFARPSISTRPMMGEPQGGGLEECYNGSVRKGEDGQEVKCGDIRELLKDVEKGLEVLAQILQSSWWDWTHGSSLCFWRWNGIEQIRAARDGMHIFVQSPLPQGRKLKQVKLASDQRPMVAEKLDIMLKRSYLDTGFVSNSLHFFAVPKGEADIRVVFDGTSSGLNETLWAPNFYLPSARDASLHLSFSSWMSDMDFGEMFHNFFMDPKVRKCAGIKVDMVAAQLRHLPLVSSAVATKGKKSSKTSFLRWTRLFMGMRPSPYNAVRHYYWGEEFARGNPESATNPMGYDRVLLNLPGMSAYDPSMPKVMKWNDAARSIAGDVITFVDDVRITGFSKENCHAVRRQFASRIQYLGMQDAPRKFRPPSQSQAGAWTGTIFRVGKESISKSVSVEKWTKGKTIISELMSMCQENIRPRLNRRSLERDTGFLNHLTMTFDHFKPYLKGFYLTLNSWRDQRDPDDWKIPDKRWRQWLLEQHYNGELSEEEMLEALNSESRETAEAPEIVVASPRFADDVSALNQFFTSTVDPPRVNLRSTRLCTVIYGFGDASGSGLGSTFTCGTGFTFRVGVWGSPDKPESSNWKEFTNVVEALEEEALEGNLNNSEVFMFTDNATVESCVQKGSSTSRKLLDLVVRLQSMTTRLGIQVHIFHVAGTRMIAQGTDGVSRGYLGQGVMAGESMSAHIPINLSAVARMPSVLIEWIQTWSDPKAFLLKEADWFRLGHDIDSWAIHPDGFDRPVLLEGRTYIWTPPPFAADVAISELRKARIKRQSSTHIVVVPRLCTTLWLRQLYKASDIVFEVPIQTVAAQKHPENVRSGSAIAKSV